MTDTTSSTPSTHQLVGFVGAALLFFSPTVIAGCFYQANSNHLNTNFYICLGVQAAFFVTAMISGIIYRCCTSEHPAADIAHDAAFLGGLACRTCGAITG